MAGLSASMAALAATQPSFYATHRTALASAFRIIYAGAANAAITGIAARDGGGAAGTAAAKAAAASSRLRFWAERSNPLVLAILGLTSGLGAGPLAALAAGQLAMLLAWLDPACRALEARHPSHPARFADAASAFSAAVGGLVAVMVGDAATLVDLAGGGGAGGGGGGGERKRAPLGPSSTTFNLPPPGARTCPARTCALVMTQLYLVAFIVPIVCTLAGSRRRRAVAGARTQHPTPSWWAALIDRHARVAALESGAAIFGTWLVLKTVDGWLDCPSAAVVAATA